MGKVVMGMTMSVDGFVNDRSRSIARLYANFDALRESDLMQEAIRNTGAVVMGRRAFEMADPDLYADNYEFQVPIFVVTHHAPNRMPRQNDRLTFTFVADGVAGAIAQAKAAAGDKDVTIIGGADVAQQALKAGLVDVLEVGIVPVLLGEGLRFLDHLGTEPIELEQIDVREFPGRTDFRFRVVR